MAVKVLGREPVKTALEQVAPIFGIESGYLVDVEEVEKKNFDPDKIKERPIIFYGFESESSLRRSGHPAAQYFYRKDCGYFQAPFQLVDAVALYNQLLNGEKPENKAATLVANVKSKKNSINILLHDLGHYPGDVGQRAMKKAEEEFGFIGTHEDVRTQLDSYRERNSSGEIKNLMGNDVVPGVFCDVDGTLIVSGKINQPWVDQLEELSKTKAVSIWTGGDVKEAEKRLYDLGIKKWPVLSKYDFTGCRVEIVFDDLPQDKFEEEYKIEATDYQKVERVRI